MGFLFTILVLFSPPLFSFLILRFLKKKVNKKVYTFFVIILITLLVILLSLRYLPGPSSWSSFAMMASLTLGLDAVIIIAGLILFLVPVWIISIFRKQYRRDPKVKTATLVFIVLVGAILLATLAREQMPRYSFYRAKKIIQYIEDYKKSHGKYPNSVDTKSIATPGVIFADYFTYTQIPDSYILSFHMSLFLMSSYEYVYTPKSSTTSIPSNYLYGEKLTDYQNGWTQYYQPN